MFDTHSIMQRKVYSTAEEDKPHPTMTQGTEPHKGRIHEHSEYLIHVTIRQYPYHLKWLSHAYALMTGPEPPCKKILHVERGLQTQDGYPLCEGNTLPEDQSPKLLTQRLPPCVFGMHTLPQKRRSANGPKKLPVLPT